MGIYFDRIIVEGSSFQLYASLPMPVKKIPILPLWN